MVRNPVKCKFLDLLNNTLYYIVLGNEGLSMYDGCIYCLWCQPSHHHQCQCQQCQGVNVSGDHKEKKFQNFLKLNDVNDRTSTLKMTDGYSNVGDNAEILVKNSKLNHFMKWMHSTSFLFNFNWNLEFNK